MVRSQATAIAALTAMLSVLVIGSCGGTEAERDQLNDRARQLNMDGNLLADVCEFDSALVVYRHALDIAEEHVLVNREIASLLNIAKVYEARPHPNPARRYRPGPELSLAADVESARVYYDRALELAREHDRKTLAAAVLVSQGILHFRSLHDFGRAEELLREGARLAKRAGSVGDEAYAWYNLGLLLAEQGRYQQAMENFKEATVLFRAAKDGEGFRLAEQCIQDIKMLLDTETD
jgi:tetratricopeptide (TPR) repeat protein